MADFCALARGRGCRTQSGMANDSPRVAENNRYRFCREPRTSRAPLQRLDERSATAGDACATAVGVRAQRRLDALRDGIGSPRDALDRMQHTEKLIAIVRLAAGIAPSNTLRTIFAFLDKAFGFLMGFFDKRNMAFCQCRVRQRASGG